MGDLDEAREAVARAIWRGHRDEPVPPFWMGEADKILALKGGGWRLAVVRDIPYHDLQRNEYVQVVRQ